jgi:hypothetical protein
MAFAWVRAILDPGPMQARSPRIALLSILAVLTATALSFNLASCATAGQRGSPGLDGSPDEGTTTPDATTDTSTSPMEGGGGDECNASTMTDPDNCGGCGIKCPSGNTCSCGLCTPPCTGTQSPCCGKCVEVSTDPNNCGTCMNVCVAPTGGNPECQGGSCTFSCPLDAGAEAGGPFVLCGADAGASGCFNLSSSAQACGSCGHACSSGDICVDSQCCASGDGICGGACTPLNTAQNCGACDAGCAAPAMCMAGQCVGYVESIGSMAFVDACTLTGSATAPGLGNQGGSWKESALVTLPFSFSLYGTAETQAFFGDTGTVGFTAPSVFQSMPDCTQAIPFTGYAAIEPFGDDNISPAKVCYATTGTAPNRQFIVTWETVTDFADPSFLMNISAVLSETTNAIDFLYEAPGLTPGGGLEGGLDGGGEAGSGDGGAAGVPITDTVMQGSNATIGVQASATTKTTLSCAGAFVMTSPFDVHLVP